MNERIISILIIILLHSGISCRAFAADAESIPGDLPGKQISQILFNIHDYPGRKYKINSMARDLIPLRPGHAYSEEAVDQSVSVLKLSGMFEDATAMAGESAGGMTVTFSLKPYLQIKDIEISGEYPLFERDILNVMTVHAGSFLRENTCSEQSEQIRQYLASEGFPEAGVNVKAGDGRDDGTTVLYVDIDKGGFARLSSLEIRGRESFSDLRIRSGMGIWKASFLPGYSGRFIDKDLDRDTKNLSSFYIGKGYPESSVTSSMRRIPETHDVEVSVGIEEGPRTVIDFRGNRSFYDFTLRKQVTIFREGNRNRAGERKSVRNIREFYQRNGYPDVTVKVEEAPVLSQEKQARRITFIIDEGPRTEIEGIVFRGNSVFTDKELLSRMQSWNRTFPLVGKRLFVRDTVDRDLREIASLYEDRGYAGTDIGLEIAWGLERRSVSLAVAIREGPQTRVTSVSFQGMTALTQDEARSCLGLGEGDPWKASGMKSYENRLAMCISEKGYPHVKVTGTSSLTADRSCVDIRFSVQEGRFVRMGSTYFSGNFKTRSKVLKRKLDMEPGDPFSLSSMVEGQNAIRDMDVFNSVTFRTIGLQEDSDVVTVIADLDEKKPYYVQASAGYESSQGLYGSTRIGDRNLLGYGKDIWVGAEASHVKNRYEACLTEPRIFNTKITGTYDLFWEKDKDFNQNFSLTVLGYNLGFTRRYGKKIMTSLNFRYERRNQSIIDQALQDQLDADLSEEDLLAQRETLKPRSIFVVTPGITLDSRDSFTRPRKGYFASYTMDISNGLLNSRDIDNFIKYRVDCRTFVTPFERVTLAWMGRVGYIQPTNNSDKIPDDQIFYLGGILDVRGYSDNMFLYDADGNPVGGRLMMLNSFEARLALFNSLELALFVDTGGLRVTNSDPAVRHVRSSYGTGLRYITPIGPISLLYGHKFHTEEAESPYKWHFSLGYTF